MTQWRSIDGEMVTAGSPDFFGYLCIQLRALAVPYFEDDTTNLGGFDKLAKKCVKSEDRAQVEAIRDLLVAIADHGPVSSLCALQRARACILEASAASK